MTPLSVQAAIPAQAATRRLAFRPGTGLPDMDRARFTSEQRLEVLIPQDRRFGAVVHDNLHLPRGPYEVEVPPLVQHVLIFGLELRQAAAELTIAGRHSRVAPRTDSFLLLPAGVDVRFVATQGAERLIHLHLAPAWLEELAEEAGLRGSARPRPMSEAHDPDLAAVLRRMAATLRGDQPAAALIREQAAVLAGVELLRVLGGPLVPRPHRIAPARLRAVRAHVEEHLSEEITLAELAGVARLSRFHFARAFRGETGVTPHRYVMARRVERAKRLIVEERLPLSAIALACGFAHQAHLTTAFRRAVGTTPGRWRQAQLA